LRMRSTSSTRREMWHYCVAPSTSKPCDATTSATCDLASSTSETWPSDEFKASRTGTSSRHLERGHSSSTRSSGPEPTRSSTRTGGSSPTHGTSNTCARFTLEYLFKSRTQINRYCMPFSHVFEFEKLVDDHVYECATTLKAGQRVFLHLCRDTPCSGATQGTMPSFRFL
jgi:hypothetical protein